MALSFVRSAQLPPRFQDITIRAQITIDGTELGDLLAIGNVPHRWGWELQSEFGEPSAPTSPNQLTQRYPVQAPTWVVVMQDYGEGETAPDIPAPPKDDPDRFLGAWDNYGGDRFLNYGRLPGNRFMINWPMHGNDYGEGTIVEPTREYGYRDLGIIQDFRRQYLDPAFHGHTNDLTLATRQYNLRRQYSRDAAVSAVLDSVFTNIVTGELADANLKLTALETNSPAKPKIR